MREWECHPSELIADFRQFYGIDLPLDAEGMDAVEDGTRWGILWQQLPAESRTARLAAPDLAWGDAERLLHMVEYHLRVLVWQRSKDGGKGRNRPKPLQTPVERSRNRAAADSALAHRAEIDRALGMA